MQYVQVFLQVAILVVFAAICSGLNISLMSLSLGDLRRKAKLGNRAAYIATGHYARVERLADIARLLRARDDNKDQTYFLYRVTSEALAKTVFPLGNLTKPEVRQIAKDRGLWTARKKESMGVCFVGNVGK